MGPSPEIHKHWNIARLLEILRSVYVPLGGAGVAGGAFLVYHGVLRLLDSEWYAINESNVTYATMRHKNKKNVPHSV